MAFKVYKPLIPDKTIEEVDKLRFEKFFEEQKERMLKEALENGFDLMAIHLAGGFASGTIAIKGESF